MIRAFIVDDEPLARDELIYLLRRTRKVEIAGEAESLEQAAAALEKSIMDVVFLDIQLSEESGLELAAQLLSKEQHPAIVFATAYDEYALKAFELNAVDYILKPFDERRVQQTVDKLEKQIEQGKNSNLPAFQDSRSSTPLLKPAEPFNRLAVMVDERIVIIHTDRIQYVGYEDGKTLIAVDDCQYRVAEALSVLERRLQSPSMLRVHRAYIVNVDRIVEMEPWFNSTYQLKMQDGATIPVSRTYMKDLKRTLGL